MSFIRTRAGLQNLRLFKDSDLIIFTEGGKRQFTVSQAKMGDFNSHAIDAHFWASLINRFSKLRSFAVRPVGTKKTLLAILSAIEGLSSSSVLVAADRDFEGQIRRSPRTKYYISTWGYSWENCIYSDYNVLDFLENHFHHDRKRQAEVLHEAKEHIRIFRRTAIRLARIDSLLIEKYNIGFFDRDKEGRDMFASNTMNISKESVSRRCRKVKEIANATKITSNRNYKNPWRYCYGKLISAFGRKLIRSYMEINLNDDAIDLTMQRHLSHSSGKFVRRPSNIYYRSRIPRWTS